MDLASVSLFLRKIRKFEVALFLLSSLTLSAQKKYFSENLFFTVGLGASGIKSTFGTDPNTWTPRFSYRLGMGYSISDRVGVGLMVSVFVLNGSNGVYLPGKGVGELTISPGTKGQICFDGIKCTGDSTVFSEGACSLSTEFGFCGYSLSITRSILVWV